VSYATARKARRETREQRNFHVKESHWTTSWHKVVCDGRWTVGCYDTKIRRLSCGPRSWQRMDLAGESRVIAVCQSASSIETRFCLVVSCTALQTDTPLPAPPFTFMGSIAVRSVVCRGPGPMLRLWRNVADEVERSTKTQCRLIVNTDSVAVVPYIQ